MPVAIHRRDADQCSGGPGNQVWNRRPRRVRVAAWGDQGFKPPGRAASPGSAGEGLGRIPRSIWGALSGHAARGCDPATGAIHTDATSALSIISASWNAVIVA